MAFKGEAGYRFKIPWTIEERRAVVRVDETGRGVFQANVLTMHEIERLRSSRVEKLNS